MGTRLNYRLTNADALGFDAIIPYSGLFSNLVIPGGWENQTSTIELSAGSLDGDDNAGTGRWRSTGATIHLDGWTQPGGITDPGVSFQVPSIIKGARILSATLNARATVTTGQQVAIRVDTPQSTPTPWSVTRPPRDHHPGLSNVTGYATSGVGVKAFDVTAQVQTAVNHAQWQDNQYLNFAFRASTGAQHLQFAAFENDLWGGMTLDIVVGLEAVEFGSAAFLHLDTPAGFPATFDNWTLSFWMGVYDIDYNPPNNAYRTIVAGDNGSTSHLDVRIDRNKLRIVARGTGHAEIFGTNLALAIPQSTSLSHWMLQAERAADRFQVWRDGALVWDAVWDNAGIPGLTMIDLHISAHHRPTEPPGGTNPDSLVKAYIAAVWQHFATTASGEALPTVDKFIDVATKTPLDLGADGSLPDVQPLIYVDGDAAVWGAGTNLGTAGDYNVVNGAITDKP